MILAQHFLYGWRMPTKYDPWLERALKLPTSVRDAATQLEHTAERLVFPDDLPSQLYSMLDNKQVTMKGILATTRLPYKSVWIEYAAFTDENEPMKTGAFLHERSDGRVILVYVCGIHVKHANQFRCGITHAVQFDQWPPACNDVLHNGEVRQTFEVEVLWSHNMEELFDGRMAARYDIGAMVSEVLYAVFLVTQPKVYTDEYIQTSDKQRKARAKDRRPPLVEYRRLTLRIGKAHKHYTRSEARSIASQSSQPLDAGDDIRHRRYHRVMGHFRHYMQPKDGRDPYTVWIEPHYRGNPELGVSFIEHDVRR